MPLDRSLSPGKACKKCYGHDCTKHLLRVVFIVQPYWRYDLLSGVEATRALVLLAIVKIYFILIYFYRTESICRIESKYRIHAAIRVPGLPYKCMRTEVVQSWSLIFFSGQVAKRSDGRTSRRGDKYSVGDWGDHNLQCLREKERVFYIVTSPCRHRYVELRNLLYVCPMYPWGTSLGL